MSEESGLSGQQEVTPSNPVAVLGTISFMTGVAAYLMCGILLFIGFLGANRPEGKEMLGNTPAVGVVVILLSIVLALVGLVTGIVGAAIRRGVKLEGRGFAVAGLIVSSSYLLIVIILLVLVLALAVFTASAFGMFFE
jgi:hypothetical protein